MLRPPVFPYPQLGHVQLLFSFVGLSILSARLKTDRLPTEMNLIEKYVLIAMCHHRTPVSYI